MFGIGINGYIGFNELGIFFDLLIYKVVLIDFICEVNKCFFEREEDVLIYVYFMGIKFIMNVKKIILFVFGENKV